jgi:hypothetical protein
MRRIIYWAVLAGILFCGCDFENDAGDNVESRFVSPVSKLEIVTPQAAASSDTASGDENDASKAIDGELSTFWSTVQLNQWTHTDLSVTNPSAPLYGLLHWITIDLGQVVDNLTKFQFHGRVGGSAPLSDVDIYVSEEVNLKVNIQRAVNAGKAWKAGSGSGWRTNVAVGDWETPVVFKDITGVENPISARYIQIRPTAGRGDDEDWAASAGEIRLYYRDAEGNEQILDYTTLPYASAYSCCTNKDRSTWIATNAIDGNPGSDNLWITGPLKPTTPNPVVDRTLLAQYLPADYHFDVGHWITLDLGKTVDKMLSLQFHRRRDGSSNGNISGMDIYASNDEIDPARTDNADRGMFLARSITNLPYAALGSTGEETWSVVSFVEPVEARYLHIRVTGERQTDNRENISGWAASAAEFRIIRLSDEYTGLDISYLMDAYNTGKLKLLEMDRASAQYIMLFSKVNAVKEYLEKTNLDGLTILQEIERQTEIDNMAEALWNVIYTYFPPKAPPEVD